MQFHPTTLSPTGVLITEGMRGEGALPPELGGRALPEALRAERDGARQRATSSRGRSRRRSTRAAASTGTCCLDMRHLGAEKIFERLHGTRELAMTFAGIDPIYEPIPVRPGAHYHMGGVDTDHELGITELEGPLRGRRVRVRLGARREPPRRERAHGDDHRSGGARGAAAADWALTHTTVAVPPGVEVDAQRELRQLSTGARASGPGRSATSCARTMHENFGVFRREEQMMQEQERIVGYLRGAVRERRRRGQGRGLQQRPDAGARSSGYLLDLADVHGRGRPRAQGEPRRPRAAVRLSGARRRELHEAHDRPLGRRPSGARTGSR